MFGDHQPPPPSELELSESQLSIQCQCHFIPKRGKDFALAPRQASTTENRVWVINIKEEFIDSFLLAILFLPTSIRLGNIRANLSIWMVQTYCTRPYKYASLRCSSKNRKANLEKKSLWPQIPSKEQSVVVEITCLTASEDTHLPWLPFLLKKRVPKPSKQETSSRGPGHPKVLDRPRVVHFWVIWVSDVGKCSWFTNLQCLGHVEERFLNWNQTQLGFIILRIVAMNPGCWGRVFISLSLQAPTKVKNRELRSQDFTGGGFNEVEKICSSNGFHVLQFSGWTHSEIWTQTPPTV